MGCAAGSYDIDANPLTGQCGCEYLCDKKSDADPIDPNLEDANCDGSDGVVEKCVYVSKSLGTAGGAGTRLDPLDTILAGIAKASALSLPSVCVSGNAAGEQYAEVVTMKSGISVYGGFDSQDPDFQLRRSATAITIVTAEGVVFDAPQIDAETHIEGLTIHSKTPSLEGQSSYGVRLLAGTAELFVRYNVIEAQKGAKGAKGSGGTAHSQAQAPKGNAGSNGCVGSNCGGGGPQPNCTEYGGKGGDGGYDSGDGQNGSPGTANAPVGMGGGDAACFGGGNDGGKGGDAPNKGAAGTLGSAGADLGTVSQGLYLPARGGDGATGKNGKGGSGGGGGGGGDDAGFFCKSDKGGGGGSGGCGGLGGDFVRGGNGGGGSFGVFAAGGKIVVAENTISTAGGGNGGDGGNGADGQLGGFGGTGGLDSDDSGAGGAGGKGSDAGAGGPGGGGGGGPSACLAYGLATQSFSKNSCQVGAAGIGGKGGSNGDGAIGLDGATGKSGFTLQVL
jgi:hypothetical protein